MAENKDYRYSMSITSQLPHCSLPLRLDSYSKCSYRCSYCFAKNRGGNHPPKGIKTINYKSVDKLLCKSLKTENDSTKTVISQLLENKTPIHFGGMSDPFMEYEEYGQKTLETLKVLRDYHYPTIISTKGTLITKDEYLKVISQSLVATQVSFSSLDDKVSSLIEFNTPLPSERLDVIKSLAAVCWVSARLQPLIPGELDSTIEAIKTLAKAGVKHISVELLKLPLTEYSKLTTQISSAVGREIEEYYSERRLMGLEFLVNREYALLTHKELSKVAWGLGISYSSADTDLLPYDSSDCCCSGVHELPGFENYYRYTFSQAIRNALRENSKLLMYEHLSCEWAPDGPINQYVNSKSRVEDANNIIGWMAAKWNSSTKSIGPLAFYGIEETECYDNNGMKIYRISNKAFELALQLGAIPKTATKAKDKMLIPN
ncbi:radical SAM protein [Pontibacter locisalis]|uniref:Radical SAM protein n=1 Tax=Pontibacter locisalis TaxID=1719035 RepID=A0ABW5IR75_9BACT